MAKPEFDRFERLQAINGRVARAAAELEARADLGALPAAQSAELDELADRLQALHVLIANEVERPWNAAEAAARRAEMMGCVHDAISAETTVADLGGADLWQRLGSEGPEGLPTESLCSSS